jgi:hypothetical protein
MPKYTLRPARPSSNPNDHVFYCDGIEVGRCYLRPMGYGSQQWLWTIYIGLDVKLIEGAPVAGCAETLDEAKAAFCRSFDRMIAAGAVKLLK